jgi:hypothetical protein
MNEAGNLAASTPSMRMGWWCAGCGAVALVLGFSLGRVSSQAPMPAAVAPPSKPMVERQSQSVLKMQKAAMAAE